MIAESPVFDEPWQARAFAIVTTLQEAGHFTSTEWASALGAEIASSGAEYYACWVAALEALLTRRAIVASGELDGALLSTRLDWPHPDHTARRDPVARSLRSPVGA